MKNESQLTPEQIETIRIWQSQDASLLVLSDEKVWEYIRQEEFEKKSEEDKKKIWEEINKEGLVKLKALNECRNELLKQVKEKGFSESDIRITIEFKVKDKNRQLEDLKGAPFPVWKTIKLGTYKTLGAIQNTIESIRVGKSKGQICPLAENIFQGVDLSRTEIEVDLTRVTVKELGFNGSTTLVEIYDRAKALGLELCPNEVGPQLRLEYLDQPIDEYIWVAMEPITGSDGKPHVFGVVHCLDIFFLRADYHDSFSIPWGPELQFVFRRRRQDPQPAINYNRRYYDDYLH